MGVSLCLDSEARKGGVKMERCRAGTNMEEGAGARRRRPRRDRLD